MPTVLDVCTSHSSGTSRFEPEHSTENEVRRALTNNGHVVLLVQEGNPDHLDTLTTRVAHPSHPQPGLQMGPIDLVLWTRTASKAAISGDARYWRLLATAHKAGVPVVGYHLDRWWGLKRQSEIELDPFFRVDLLCTADGGHDEQWEKVGVNHAWFPPAISERNCFLGTPRDEFKTDIVFVGSWQGGYHEEWGHRDRLVRWLRHNYDRRVTFWQKPGEHAIRGAALNDLYASAKVVVGDSCLVPKPDGSPMTHYCSDRVPETLGRGGLLLHPSVPGVTGTLFQHHWWDLDDWNGLGSQIEALLACQYEGRRSYAVSAQDRVRTNDTYEVRMRQLVDLLNERGML